MYRRTRRLTMAADDLFEVPAKLAVQGNWRTALPENFQRFLGGGVDAAYRRATT